MSLNDARRKITLEMPNRCENASGKERRGGTNLSSPLSPTPLLTFHLVPTSATLRARELGEM